jgi:hypothetical protein
VYGAKTPITSSFLGFVKRGRCPLCDEPIAVNFGFKSLMLCRNCGDYLEVADNNLLQMDPKSVMERPAFAAPTEWSDMRSPTYETIPLSFPTETVEVAGELAQEILMKKEGVRLVAAKWPAGCCVCGEPSTRSETTSQTFIFVPPGIIRVRDSRATVMAKDIPHCSRHKHGAQFDRAMFSTPEQETTVGLFFRSYAYQIQFRQLNPWKWSA